MGRIVECFKSHPSCQGTVSDDGNDPVILFSDLPGFHISESCGDGGGAVSGIESVALAFIAFREPAHAAIFPQIIKSLSSSG